MNKSISSYILFLISPIFGLGFSILQWREQSTRNIICLFTCFYGIVFFVQSDSNTDSVRYAQYLTEMHQSGITFDALRDSFYQEGQVNYDLYQPLTTFFVSCFTDDVQVLFGIYGLVLGYFFSRVIFHFLDNLRNTCGFWEFFSVGTLAFVLNIGSGINGVRMHTAFFILLFGILNYWSTRRTIYLLVAASSILVHYSFVIPVTLLLSVPFLKVFSLPIYLVFLASFVMTTVDVGFVRDLVSMLPGGIDRRVGGYLNELNPESSEIPRLLMVNLWLLHLFTIATVTFLIGLWRRQDVPAYFTEAMTFMMLLYTATNFLSSIGSIGRFYTLCHILLVGYLMLTVNWFSRTDSNAYAGYPLMALTLVNSAYNLRMFLGFSSYHLLVGNPFTVWFFDAPEFTLYDYVPPIFKRF